MELRAAYAAAGPRDKASAVHMFGLERAEDLRRHSIDEVVRLAGLGRGYANELRKMIKIAPRVRVTG
jgi:hypothetical protein